MVWIMKDVINTANHYSLEKLIMNRKILWQEQNDFQNISSQNCYNYYSNLATNSQIKEADTIKIKFSW